jgi:hypothetical protein
MGEHGQAFVRDRFLVPRLLLDYLELIQELA